VVATTPTAAVSAGSTCPFCGNSLMDDSNYCRKCGKHRPGAHAATAAADASSAHGVGSGVDAVGIDLGASAAALGLGAGSAPWMSMLRPKRSSSAPRSLTALAATAAERLHAGCATASGEVLLSSRRNAPVHTGHAVIAPYGAEGGHTRVASYVAESARA